MPEAKTTETKTINREDVAKTINTIVDLMLAIDSSREMINDKIKHLKSNYGLNASDVRAAATAIKKQNVEELDEKAKRIQELIDLCL